jgi:hypothetical protein
LLCEVYREHGGVTYSLSQNDCRDVSRPGRIVWSSMLLLMEIKIEEDNR